MLMRELGSAPLTTGLSARAGKSPRSRSRTIDSTRRIGSASRALPGPRRCRQGAARLSQHPTRTWPRSGSVAVSIKECAKTLRPTSSANKDLRCLLFGRCLGRCGSVWPKRGRYLGGRTSGRNQRYCGRPRLNAYERVTSDGSEPRLGDVYESISPVMKSHPPAVGILCKVGTLNPGIGRVHVG